MEIIETTCEIEQIEVTVTEPAFLHTCYVRLWVFKTKRDEKKRVN